MNINFVPENLKLACTSQMAREYIQLFADCCTRLFPDLAKTFNGRLNKAIEIALNPIGSDTFVVIDEHRVQVKSQSNYLGAYIVDVKSKTCTCPGYGYLLKRGLPPYCKHRIAVSLRVYGEAWYQYADLIKNNYLIAVGDKWDETRRQIGSIRWEINASYKYGTYLMDPEKIASLEEQLPELEELEERLRHTYYDLYKTPAPEFISREVGAQDENEDIQPFVVMSQSEPCNLELQPQE